MEMEVAFRVRHDDVRPASRGLPLDEVGRTKRVTLNVAGRNPDVVWFRLVVHRLWHCCPS